MVTFNIDLVMIVLAFLIGYLDDITGPQHHYYQDTSVKVYKKYQCPNHCKIIHPHFVYYNSLTNGIVIEKSLLGKKIKVKKNKKKK
jgi:hypothetical protein